jgi:hypothetical protein
MTNHASVPSPGDMPIGIGAPVAGDSTGGNTSPSPPFTSGHQIPLNVTTYVPAAYTKLQLIIVNKEHLSRTKNNLLEIIAIKYPKIPYQFISVFAGCSLGIFVNLISSLIPLRDAPWRYLISILMGSLCTLFLILKEQHYFELVNDKISRTQKEFPDPDGQLIQIHIPTNVTGGSNV